MRKLIILVALFCFISHGFCKNEYYKTLSVSPKATDVDIRKAYRSLAKKWHPDRFRDEKEKEKAEKKFMKISEAYETLSDTEKRQIYDEEQRSNRNFNHGMPRQQNRYSFKSNGAKGFETFSKYQNSFSGDSFGAFADILASFGQNKPRDRGSRGSFPFSRQSNDAQTVSNALKKHFISSIVKILSGSEITKNLGKSFRGNQIWFTFMITSPNAVELMSEKINFVAEKYNDLFLFSAIDCSILENESFCRKQGALDKRHSSLLKAYHPYATRLAIQVRKGSDILKAVELMLNMLPSPLFIDKLLTEKDWILHVKNCLKQKEASLGCIFIFSEKVSDSSKISWKLKGISHRLKDRAIVHVVSLKRSKAKQWLAYPKPPFVGLYRNNRANKIDVTIENMEITSLHGSSFTYLKEKLGSEIWQY